MSLFWTTTSLLILSVICFGKSSSASEVTAAELQETLLKSLSIVEQGVRYEFRYHCEMGGVKTDGTVRGSIQGNKLKMVREFLIRDLVSDAPITQAGPYIAILNGDKMLSRNSQLQHSNFVEFQNFDSDPTLYESKHLFWPQTIGTCPATLTMMPTTAPRGELLRKDWTVLSIKEDSVDALKLIRVDYETPHRIAQSVWYSPQQGGLVFRIEERAKNSGGHFSATVVNELREWQPGIWFPQTIRTERDAGGERISETIEVLQWKVGAIDANEFTLLGLEVPEGGIIYDSTVGEGTRFRMTSTGPVEMTEEEVLQAFPANANSADFQPARLTVSEPVRDALWPRWVIVINGFLLGATLLWVGARQLRRF